jgi:hypothetical protein
MFLTHEQHGTGEAAELARGKHERLGKTILAAAAVSAMGELFVAKGAKAAGAALLLASGVQLIVYREPQGAYEKDGTHKIAPTKTTSQDKKARLHERSRAHTLQPAI